MKSFIHVAGSLGVMVWSMWCWPAFILYILKGRGMRGPRAAYWLRAELRPFALPALLTYYVPDIAMHFRWYQVVFLAMNLVAWHLYRKDDDDDRWKRRKEKLAAKVAEVGGRLQVVPVTSS